MESILSYNCENVDSGLQIQDKAVKYRNKFFENHCKNVQAIKSKNEVIRNKMGVIQTVL